MAQAVGASLRHLEAGGLPFVALLATGEPCAMCYRFAASHGVGAVYYAVDRDTTGEWGFDYRPGYHALDTAQLSIAATVQHLPVDLSSEPFIRYAQLHYPHMATDSTNSAIHIDRKDARP